MSDISSGRTGALTPANGYEPFSALAGAVLDLVAAFRRAVRQAAAFEELNRLSDAGLARRGLSRSQISRHVVDTVR